MDPRDKRPPRSARPPSTQQQQRQDEQLPSFPDQSQPYPFASRPSLAPLPFDGSRDRGGNVSFQHTPPARPERQRTMPSPYQNNHLAGPGYDAEANDFDAARVGRKKSLVRPDREKIEPGHRQWHYRSAIAQAEEEGAGRMGVIPSTTGNYPQTSTLRRGRSLLGRDEDMQESGLSLFKRATLRRKRPQSGVQDPALPEDGHGGGCLGDIPGPVGPWMTYCWLLTAWIPLFMMRACGIRTPEQQRAWREKMGLISIILTLMAGVGFLTFGFTIAVCGKPPNRFHSGSIGSSSVIIHGYDYDFSNFKHPAGGMFNGQTNPLIQGGWNLAANDASFLFQKTNQRCYGMIQKAANSTITGDHGNLDWYFPCNIYQQKGNNGANITGYNDSTNCHLTNNAKNLGGMKPMGQVYYTWDDVMSSSRNLAVFESSILDLELLDWLSKAQVTYPSLFDELRNANGTYNGKDITMNLLRNNQRNIGHCLEDIITVGFIDTNSIGCVASQVVLYVSLIFIIGVVAIKFAMAVLFAWFFSWKIGNFPRETYEERMQRSAEIEAWSNDIYRPAPSNYRPNVGKNGLRSKEKRKTFLPSHSRFTPSENNLKGASPRPTTAYNMLDPGYKRQTSYAASVAMSSGGGRNSKLTPPDTPAYRQSRSTTIVPSDQSSIRSRGNFADNPCPFPLHNVVPQPGVDYEPFNFPLAHTICLVTAYSESVEGLRTTLDSLATTDYPNSHKLLLIVADGMVKGAGNSLTTPEICLGMMKDFIIQPQDVEAHSYVAIADGHKRHNMAKIYAGFYDYDDATTERSKQQRVPIVLVAKCGNPLEQNDAKPGNRGKRDSQIVLMGFLQKVMFDERMTTFEYEFFNCIWRVAGVSPDRYELVLCVDADTKVFPDSLTRMVSCMVHDEEIMGLCGETKIANKGETLVTMMQVFEYYISHHMTKAFESMFGGVTCLPGCFSMYRIKAPKGDSGYWVPILANPDIVEHYSENVVDTLHKKNLLLLGEDRYLTTLMLKTFPKRKNVFCPQAVCKTVVPDTFRILLSQRRRWINSTVHNLAELLLVRDLCGTFCFSMQFVIGMELAGTLVLPAAIAFTLYLIIETIIPGGPNTTISLVLLGIILGLPGVLIIVTSRKLSYVGWMLIYLFCLPIWNGLLPAYSFWHFDDFSWGETRKIQGNSTDDNGDKEGEFDSAHIVMKRWAEFERDRRWKNGTQSRDSTVFDRKTADSNRYSLNSNSDNYHPGSNGFDSSTTDSAANTGAQRPRNDANALLMLPAPLGRPTTSLSRSSEDVAYMSDGGSTSNQRLISSPASPEYDGTYETPQSKYPAAANASLESQLSRTAGNAGVILRNPTLSNQYPGETPNPFRNSEPYSAGYDETHGGYTADPEDYSGSSSTPTQYTQRQLQGGRGVSLSDHGPVPGPGGVRRVSKPVSKTPRPASQTPPAQNRYSRGSTSNLPPGAAAPQPGGYTGGGYGY